MQTSQFTRRATSLIAKGIVAPTYIDTALNHADMISKANLTGHAGAIRRFNNQE
jgi:hypothetical protein